MWCTVETIVLGVVVVLAFRQHNVRALINERCYTREINELAKNDGDICRIANAFCQPVNENYGLCTCHKGYRASRDERACLTEIGKRTCQNDSECDVINSVCDKASRCACRYMYIVSRDKTNCLPPLGRSCLSNSECSDLVPNSVCDQGVCDCIQQFVPSKNQTACLPVLGQRCNVHNDCLVQESYCDNGLCACARSSHVPSYNKTVCLPVVMQILASCEEDEQCMNEFLGQDTRCLNRQCMCRYGDTTINTSCQKRKELDDWCSHSQQCQMIERASCVQNKCACDPYYVPYASNRTVCIPVAILYGSPCVHNVQCTVGFGDGGRCMDGSCQCVDNYHFVINHTGRCVPNRGIGQSCTNNECFLPADEAKQMIECVDHECRCKMGIEPSLDNTSCSGATHIYTRNLLSIPFLIAITLTILVKL